MFGQDRHALSMGRIPIGASDYSTAAYSYDDGCGRSGVEALQHSTTTAITFAHVRAALTANPDLFLFASPWSPPGWMKYSNSMFGRKHPAGKYSHLRAILSEIRGGVRGGGRDGARGYHQNEIDADQGGRMPACPWPEETRNAWSRSSAHCSTSGTKNLELAQLQLFGRASITLEAGFKKYVNTVAWHGYWEARR